VETAGAAFWRLLPEGVRVITVRRPVADVLASLRRGGLTFNDAPMIAMLRDVERKLDQIERRVPGVMAVTYDDLATEEGCARVFEHCLGLAHDHAWWAACDRVNIQISLPHLVRYMTAHRPQLDKLAKVAKHRCLFEMNRAPRDIDGVTFQHEPFREFWRDAAPLLSAHAVEAGEAPDYPASLNVPLMEMLDDTGALQTITARQNGRMFGYLMSVVTPTIEAPDLIEAWHSIFFASPDMPGIGMRLQRAALDGLRKRGVKNVIMRAGHRASGPRLGTFYRRLGAGELGMLYKLELN
jgi:hypothetical protein